MKQAAQHAFTRQSQGAFRLRLKPIAALAFSMMACATIPQAAAESAGSDQGKNGTAAEVSFDNTYLRQDGNAPIDTSRFTRGNAVSPGTYSVDLFVNGARLSREDIRTDALFRSAVDDRCSGTAPTIRRDRSRMLWRA